MAWHHEQNGRLAELIYEGLQIRNCPSVRSLSSGVQNICALLQRSKSCGEDDQYSCFNILCTDTSEEKKKNKVLILEQVLQEGGQLHFSSRWRIFWKRYFRRINAVLVMKVVNIYIWNQRRESKVDKKKKRNILMGPVWF